MGHWICFSPDQRMWAGGINLGVICILVVFKAMRCNHQGSGYNKEEKESN